MVQDVAVVVILHDLQNLDLVAAKAFAIQVDEVPEEVEQLCFVNQIGLFLNQVAHLADQPINLGLVVKHVLVVVVQLSQHVDTPNVFMQVPQEFRHVGSHLWLNLLMVFDQAHY